MPTTLLSSILSPTILRKTVYFEDVTTGAKLERATTAANGSVTALGTGSSVQLTGSMYATGTLRATQVWMGVYNDYADFQRLIDKLEYGKCYYDTYEGAKICSERCQLSVIGIATDTFGISVGSDRFEKEVPIAVSGWVLAFVDKQYPSGTPLTNDANGNLTEMTLQEKRDYPERLIAMYKSPEYDQFFTVQGKQIPVNGRHWVKVK